MKLFIFKRVNLGVQKVTKFAISQNDVPSIDISSMEAFWANSELVPCAHLRQDAISCQVNKTAQHQQKEHICSEVQFLISPL